MSDQRRIIEALLAQRARGGGRSPSGHVLGDADAMAAHLAGRLVPSEAEAFEARLASDPVLRGVWIELRKEEPEASRAEGRELRLPVPLALAAVLLLGLGLVLLARRGSDAPPNLDARLLARARVLQAEQPELFSGFVPLDRIARLERSGVVHRGGLVLESPRGAVRVVRPAMRWRAPPGAGPFRVTVEEAESGRVLLETAAGTGSRPWPADAPAAEPGASYLWRVEGRGALGSLGASAMFRVLAEAEARRFEQALQLLDAPGAGLEDRLLAVHVAIRMELWADARVLLARVRPARASAHVAELVAHVEDRLGFLEAESPR